MIYRYSAAFMVLLYGKEIADSETLNSIKNIRLNNERFLLVIWNNGPKSIDCDNLDGFYKLGFDITIKESLENQSLAKIYNQFISEINSEKYIVLDDDSKLNQGYIDQVFRLNSTQIGVPLITCNNKLVGPKLNDRLCDLKSHVCNKDKFFAIGSGLVLGHKIAKKMQIDLGQIFDERFYFYGVDATFFFRVKKIKLNKNIKIISGFEHSLSYLKKESDITTSFRLKEMSYDLGLRLRFYKPIYASVFKVLGESVSSIIKKFRKERQKSEAKYLLKAFFTGKHYRS